MKTTTREAMAEALRLLTNKLCKQGRHGRCEHR